MLIAMAAADTLSPYIEFKDVSKAFGDRVVLQDVSFDVLPGEMVCILGRSGVGKSVALHNIMGFLKPDSGRVIVAGQDITDYNQQQLEGIHKKVTMVFQNGALFDSLSVGENVAFPLREKRELSEDQIYQVVDGLLDMVGVKEMRDQLPSDLYETFRPHRPSARRPTRVRPLRRAHYHGRSADGQSARRSHRPAQTAIAPDLSRGHARHAPGQEAGRPHRFPLRRPRNFLWPLQGHGEIHRAHHSGVPKVGRLGAGRVEASGQWPVISGQRTATTLLASGIR